jgi:hypothetical protein
MNWTRLEGTVSIAELGRREGDWNSAIGTKPAGSARSVTVTLGRHHPLEDVPESARPFGSAPGLTTWNARG